MRTLFLDCTLGVSGDMLIASLLCHLKDTCDFERAMESLGLCKSVSVIAEDTVKHSLAGKTFNVSAKDGQPIRRLSDIEDIINGSSVNETVKTKSAEAFKALAEAESKVHGISPDKVRFHEIGAIDTIIDIVGFYTLLDILGVDRVITSPVNVGSGRVTCEHGVLPVPVPAVTELMKGKEVFSQGEDGERTTPTGAVLVTQSSEQGKLPEGRLLSTGCGFGKRDFQGGNYVRSILTEDIVKADEYVYLLECSIDDMTAEELGFAAEQILADGALDVWQEAVYMKKNRLGTKLSVLCREVEPFVELIFKHTTTLGVRINHVVRRLRGESTFTEADGIRIKCTGDVKKPEYEDVRMRAMEEGVSLFRVYDSLK